MRRKAAEGKVVRIPLDERSCCFAKLLVFPLVSFHDNRVPTPGEPAPLDLGRFLFKVWVSKEGWNGKRWKVVGKQDVAELERISPEFFKKDKVDGEYYKYRNGLFSRSTLQECASLERAAVWDPAHVEERLRAYFSSEKSTFEKSMRA